MNMNKNQPYYKIYNRNQNKKDKLRQMNQKIFKYKIINHNNLNIINYYKIVLLK